MAKIKSYTDIEQSNKLAEILPLGSADMFCADVFLKERETHSYNFHILSTWSGDTFEDMKKDRENQFVHFIPVWSLSALLGVLPDYTLQTNTEGTVFVVCESKKPMISDAYDNPVDACVAMIEELHELKML